MARSDWPDATGQSLAMRSRTACVTTVVAHVTNTGNLVLKEFVSVSASGSGRLPNLDVLTNHRSQTWREVTTTDCRCIGSRW
jgi:hypothetical protein